MCFTDFPTETYDEAMDTLRFLEELRDAGGALHRRRVRPHARRARGAGAGALRPARDLAARRRPARHRAVLRGDASRPSAATTAASSTRRSIACRRAGGCGAIRGPARCRRRTPSCTTRSSGRACSASARSCRRCSRSAPRRTTARRASISPRSRAADDDELAIWHELVREQRHVSRAAYHALAKALPPLPPQPRRYRFVAGAAAVAGARRRPRAAARRTPRTPPAEPLRQPSLGARLAQAITRGRRQTKLQSRPGAGRRRRRFALDRRRRARPAPPRMAQTVPLRGRERKTGSRRGHALAHPRARHPARVDATSGSAPSPNGHMQATGRDARGRKQYRYHARWREKRDETKYDHMLAFGRRCPRSARRVDEDLAPPGLPREKVLATVVRLLETTLIRVGNEEYARDNDSFGLTTLRDRHVDVDGARAALRVPRQERRASTRSTLRDRRLARIVRAARTCPGQELFQYVDDDGARRTIDSQDVNDYLREITRPGLHGQGLPHLERHRARGGRAVRGGAGRRQSRPSARSCAASSRWPSASATPRPSAASATCTPRSSTATSTAACSAPSATATTPKARC